MFIRLGVAAVCVLSGCAMPPLREPNVSPQELALIRYQCEQDARVASQSVGFYYRTNIGASMAQAIREGQIIRECLIAHGFKEAK